ncbi:MAG: HAD-IC family P-type ATPase [Clostridia bacterium]|nr:HAD-IC family P-type ATPase [Clostridia bacterium]
MIMAEKRKAKIKAEQAELVQQVASDKPQVEEIPPHVTDVQTGLTKAEVDERVAAGKINGEQTIRTKSVWQILRENIFTFFNFIFVALAIVLAFFNPKIGNFGFLLLIVFNTAAGIFQGLRSKRIMDKLALLSAPKALVIRDGEEVEIPLEQIVIDDITVLSAGKQICADGVIVEGSIEVNESLITGESDAIVKNVGDKVLSGSFVVSGKARCQVEHIGQDNFVMKISSGAKYVKKPTSEIWRSLMFVVKVMSIIIVPIGVATLLVKWLGQGNDLNNTVVTTIGSIIGMIPNGLVALATTVFCVSIIRLSKHKTVAQDLYCVETLARVDVLCLDKTGTITEGTMEVNGIEPIGNNDVDEIKQALKNIFTALEDDNATANALRTYVQDLTVSGEAEAKIPFSSQRKWSGVRINGKSYVIGAPEFVFAKQTAEMKQKVADMAKQGYRVMVLASSAKPFGKNALPKSLEAEAYIYITDKIRDEAPDTLKFFREQGVTVKIISGDNPETVHAVALRAGLKDCDNIIDMSTLHSEQEVYEAAEKYTIFGRVLPDQKLMLVKALKKNGHTVAMTGDGVNDVLALKEADCSVAMASGSDAAKNVSSLVLLDSNFASMPKVVAEGRRSINNLERSASLYLMKTMYSILLAILFLCIPTEFPFEPRHLTIIGMVTIGIPSVVLALEPSNERVTGHFLPKVLSSALAGSITVLIGICAVIITKTWILTDLTKEQFQNACLIVTTFVGLIYLLKVSLPLTIIHALNFVGMIGLFLGCYFTNLSHFKVPGLNLSLQDFFGLTSDFSTNTLKAIALICYIVLILFIATVFLTRNVNRKDESNMVKILRKCRVLSPIGKDKAKTEVPANQSGQQ